MFSSSLAVSMTSIENYDKTMRVNKTSVLKSFSCVLLKFIALNINILLVNILLFQDFSWIAFYLMMKYQVTVFNNHDLWRIIFFFYEIIFYFTIDNIKKEISILTEDEAYLLKSKYKTIINSIKLINLGFGWFLFLFYVFYCLTLIMG